MSLNHSPISESVNDMRTALMIHLHLVKCKFELIRMLANPEQHTLEKIQWKRSSIELFESLVHCHFPENFERKDWQADSIADSLVK